MKNKDFCRKNVQMAKEKESKKIKWLGKSLIKTSGCRGWRHYE